MQLHHPRHRDSQGQETFLVASADKQTRNYYTECSNHHPTLSTLSSKGLSCSKMKWWSIYYKFTSKCHSETTPSSAWIYIYYIYIYIYIYIYMKIIGWRSISKYQGYTQTHSRCCWCCISSMYKVYQFLLLIWHSFDIRYKVDFILKTTALGGFAT